VEGQNVILLVVESLSALDSFRTSGLGNHYPRLDEISKNGMLFTNFFSSYTNSEGGIVALLNGLIPIAYPGSKFQPYEEFSKQPSVISEFNKLGYFTEAIRPNAINFLNVNQYVREIGFDSVKDATNVKMLEQAPKFVFKSVSDETLYSYLLQRLPSLNTRAPFFVAIFTASSHLPYNHPEKGDNTLAGISEYVDRQLGTLYQELVAQNYFQDGILIITGDHRRFSIVSEDEYAKYGDSAGARIPLVIVGEGVSPNTINHRFFQQRDLFRKLADAVDVSKELSPHIVFVNRWNVRESNNEHSVSIYTEETGGRSTFGLDLCGAELVWRNKPLDFPGIEKVIHAQRAYCQMTNGAQIDKGILGKRSKKK
jgi:phosphoglycerol transferase MdoB-like AlkP superfamily enzyme